MLVHVSDVTPGSMQFVWTPHSTWDDLLAVNVLAIPCLEWYFRHTSRYDPTLTKLVEAAGGHGKDALAKANAVLYQRRYLVRFEFGISIPAGERGRTNQRFSRICASRVPITDEQLADLVRQHTPGKYTLIPWGEPKRGEPVEQRRVRVTSCEVYADTTLKISACVCPDHPDREACEADGCETPHGDPLLSPHAGRGGKRGKREPAKRTPPKWEPKNAVQHAPDDQPDEVPPEVGIPTSGGTSGNDVSPHVPPEVDLPKFGGPTSKEKKEPEEQEPEQARAAASGSDPAALRLAGPKTSAAASVGGSLGPPPATQPPDARADPKRWHGIGGMIGDDSPAARNARAAIISGRPGPTRDQRQRARGKLDPAVREQVRAELARRPAGLTRAAGLPLTDDQHRTGPTPPDPLAR